MTSTDLAIAVTPPAVTDQDLIDEWTASPEAALLSITYRKRTRSLARDFARSTDATILEATTADIESWLAGRSITLASRRIYQSILERFFRWTVATGRRSDNPVTALVVPRLPRQSPPHPIPVDEDRADRPTERRCGLCHAAPAADLRRVGGSGPPVCPTCYQRGRRDGLVAARANGDGFHAALVDAGLSRKSIRIYSNIIRSAQRWFDEQGWQLSTATGGQIVAYADTLPESWASRKGLRSALIRYWQLTQHPRPPVKAIRVPPKPTMVCLALEDDEARILAKAARSRGDLKGFAVVLGLYQALRREEIATLRWEVFDEPGWMTIQGKNRKRRTIPVHPVVTDYLARLPRRDAFVFPGRRGGSVNPATIWAWIGDVADEAGVLDVRPHRLRHSSLATMNDATGDLRTVQAFAGHSNPQTTAGYTRASKRRLQEAVLAVQY